MSQLQQKIVIHQRQLSCTAIINGRKIKNFQFSGIQFYLVVNKNRTTLNISFLYNDRADVFMKRSNIYLSYNLLPLIEGLLTGNFIFPCLMCAWG